MNLPHKRQAAIHKFTLRIKQKDYKESLHELLEIYNLETIHHRDLLILFTNIHKTKTGIDQKTGIE